MGGILGEQKMKRTREYRRSVAETHIARKKWISRHIYFFDWYRNDNQYSKNKIHCSCWMCAHRDAYYQWLFIHGMNDEMKEELEEAGLDLEVPNRERRSRKYSRSYSHYSKHWS